ncbi:restriction endonuclease subunit S [Streptococcus parauberis]|uniref:Restriction endonuclease subunit S n=2 Tax=Streptococcus parauberis TaxID=1348 RepID=A0AAE4HYX0_9STRE|nr:restriction endonuclease subunit S [Streptococcus parauberis]MDT2732503.1 restriction endonuclease subunit S [Streptococcus parauberis]
MSKKSPQLRFEGFTDDWEERKLGDVGNTFTGLTGKTKEDFGHGSAKFVTYVNVFQNPIATLDQLDAIEIDEKQNQVQKGDIFFTTSSETPEEVGMSSVWTHDTENVYLNSFTFGYRPRVSFDLNYMASMLRSPSIRKKITFLAQGISRYNISKTKMLEIEIPTPTLSEQEKIGSFFKQLDNTIALHQRKLDLLKEQKKGYLQKMFPKNGAKVPELRFAGFADDWEERKLGDIVVKAIDNRGKTPPTSENDKYPLLEVASIGGYYPNYSKVTKFVNYNIFNSWFRAHLKKGDILFSTVGNTGLATLMDDNQDATIAQNIVGFRAKNSNVPEFLLQMFKLPSNLKKAKRIEMGAVQPSIKVSQLIEVQYLLPKCKHEQEKIGSFFKQLDDTIALHQRKLDLLKEQKKGFLQKMFV